MANKAISELPQALNVNNQDLFVLEQSGIAKKLTAETFITEQGIIDALAAALDGHGGIQSVTLSSVSGRIRTYLITFTDGSSTTFQVLDGTSISRIEKTSTAGLVDTYTVYMTDGTTSFFQVRNGQDGSATWDQINSKAPIITETVTGAIASFPDGADDIPVADLVVNIEPVQSGSGDPSPDNIRPITGWTGVTISHSGADTSNPETISISWQSEAGTVYGGTIDVATGLLTVDRVKITFDGTQTVGSANWRPMTNSVGWLYAPNQTPGIDNTKITNDNFSTYKLISDTLKFARYSGTDNIYTTDAPAISIVGSIYFGIAMRVNDTSLTTATAINAWLALHPVTVVYPLATPQTYQLTPQQLKTLYGTNNVWADTGDTSVTYSADTKIYLKLSKVVLTATIVAADWASSDPYTNSVSVNGLLATDTPIMDLIASSTYATAQAETADYAYIYKATCADNTLMLYASQAPTVDLNVQLLCLR